MKTLSVDTESQNLAEHFLQDTELADDPISVDALARTIQTAVEEWLEEHGV